MPSYTSNSTVQTEKIPSYNNFSMT